MLENEFKLNLIHQVPSLFAFYILSIKCFVFVLCVSVSPPALTYFLLCIQYV